MKIGEALDSFGLGKEAIHNADAAKGRTEVETWLAENVHQGASQQKRLHVARRLVTVLKNSINGIAERLDHPTEPLEVEEMAVELANMSPEELDATLSRLDKELTRLILVARIHGYFDAWRDDRALQKGETYCPVCRRRFISEYGAISRRDNETLICNTCGDRQGLEGLQLGMRTFGDPDTPTKVPVPSIAFANSNQLRRIAGNSHRFSLGYGLDFRLDTILDQTGLHLLSAQALIPADLHPSGWAVIVANVSLKVAFLTADQPLDDIALSVRTRDWMALEPPAKYLPGEDDNLIFLNLRSTDIVGDEFSPDPANPDQVTQKPPAGLANMRRVRPASTWDLGTGAQA